MAMKNHRNLLVIESRMTRGMFVLDVYSVTSVYKTTWLPDFASHGAGEILNARPFASMKSRAGNSLSRYCVYALQLQTGHPGFVDEM